MPALPSAGVTPPTENGAGAGGLGAFLVLRMLWEHTPASPSAAHTLTHLSACSCHRACELTCARACSYTCRCTCPDACPFTRPCACPRTCSLVKQCPGHYYFHPTKRSQAPSASARSSSCARSGSTRLRRRLLRTGLSSRCTSASVQCAPIIVLYCRSRGLLQEAVVTATIGPSFVRTLVTVMATATTITLNTVERGVRDDGMRHRRPLPRPWPASAGALVATYLRPRCNVRRLCSHTAASEGYCRNVLLRRLYCTVDCNDQRRCRP